MKTLTVVECLNIVCCSRCPECHKFVAVQTDRTEENLITTWGICGQCNIKYAVDRTYPLSLNTVITGHAYFENDY